MEISGKIVAVINEKNGVSASTGKPWRVVEYLLETIEAHPRHVAFEVFGEERIAACHIEVGEVLTVSFDLSAREFNGRWFNQLRAWQVVRPDGVAAARPKALAVASGAASDQQAAAPSAAHVSPAAPSAAVVPPQRVSAPHADGCDPLPSDIVEVPPF